MIEYKGQLPCDNSDYKCIEVPKDIYDNYQDYIYSDGEIILNPNLDKIKLNKAKEDKIALNDDLRDTALFGGVTYNNVLFDSDTDQKINISETVRDMSDTDTITWFGMDNTALLCTKADLLAIGEEIRNLTKFCWGNNAYIKEQIANAQTMKELEAIEINYNEN